MVGVVVGVVGVVIRRGKDWNELNNGLVIGDARGRFVRGAIGGALLRFIPSDEMKSSRRSPLFSSSSLSKAGLLLS